jgi:replication factor C subunit 3/5
MQRQGKLLLDLIRPDHPSAFSYNREPWKIVDAIASLDSCPHILLHGPSGSGKRTFLQQLLRALFGEGVDKIQPIEYKTVSAGNNKKNITVMQSPHHLVINSNGSSFDKHIPHDIVIQYARSFDMNPCSEYTSLSRGSDRWSRSNF